MFKIDKTLIDNMNINRSCIVITHKETVKEREKLSQQLMTLEDDEQMPPSVREKAREFVQNANTNAQKIIRNATLEAEEIRETARQEGYEAGLEEGRAELNAKLKSKMAEVKDVLSRVEEYRQELYQTLESHVLELSMDVAEKILNLQMERDDKLYKDIVKRAVAGIKHADNFSLYVSQAEYDKYFKEGTQWLHQETNCGSFEVVCDAKLPQGSCVIEADSEIVDAGIPMQLKKIGQYLSEQVE